jgi:hypothetical protein
VHCAATDWPIPLAFKFSVVAFTGTAIVADGGQMAALRGDKDRGSVIRSTGRSRLFDY